MLYNTLRPQFFALSCFFSLCSTSDQKSNKLKCTWKIESAWLKWCCNANVGFSKASCDQFYLLIEEKNHQCKSFENDNCN